MLKETLEKLQTNEEKERLVLGVVEEEIAKGDYDRILEMLTSLQDDWSGLSTARLTKIFKQIFGTISIGTDNYEGVIRLLNGLIDWSGDRMLLKSDLECKLIYVYLTTGMYKETLDLIKVTVKRLKKFEDKINLIRVFLYESRAYYELKNLNMAKSALTAARALAVSVTTPSSLQAQIDLLNGMFLVDEKYRESATGYFVEAIEGFQLDKMPENAKLPLVYLVLCKMLDNKVDELKGLMQNKYVRNLQNENENEMLQVLIELAQISKHRDVVKYKGILADRSGLLQQNLFILKHLNLHYNELLNQNILKIVEPYSRVKITFIASKLNFEESLIEDKLRMMILDKAIYGILDHRTQSLILYEKKEDGDVGFRKNIAILREYMCKL
ncbi:PSD11 [Enterospora canceri]|uniref:PSD11 n=1 Tax=Enterospora canceri TaxID=1081671 RepID=A0A1Y1S7D3_9MICR|nr:PSD11 [Enterospora canceri]